MSLTFLDLAYKILKEEKIPLSTSEIWQKASEKGFDKQLNSNGKTPYATLGALVYVDVRDNSSSRFGVDGSRPKKFYLKEIGNLVVQVQNNTSGLDKKNSYLEKDLHPFLAYYAFYYLKCYSKTLNHTKSSKKEFGEWVHPDIVACHFPIDEWKPEVLELSSAIGNISIKIVSFELKLELNFSNLRESFFQAVSNSSWANESYLVTSEISKDEEFLTELTRLSSAFGIGIIALDLENPDNSETILPPKYREYLDWETVNKLTMNSDFKEFLKRIRIDLSSKTIHKSEYDKVYDKDDLIKLVKKK